MHEAPYILPTGERMNPASPESATYYDRGQTAFVLKPLGKDRATRVFTSFGGECDLWAIGTLHLCRHDQSGNKLGEFEVVGVANFETGERKGEVPDRPLYHAVFK